MKTFDEYKEDIRDKFNKEYPPLDGSIPEHLAAQLRPQRTTLEVSNEILVMASFFTHYC